MRALLPGQLEAQPDLLDQLGSMVSPKALKQHGVTVYGVTQEAGQFVVTFPSAYTAAINTGFNLVESVAAAPPDWWDWAEAAAARLRASRRVPVSLKGGVWRLGGRGDREGGEKGGRVVVLGGARQ